MNHAVDALGRAIHPDEYRYENIEETLEFLNKKARWESLPVTNNPTANKLQEIAVSVQRSTLFDLNNPQHAFLLQVYRDDEYLLFRALCKAAITLIQLASAYGPRAQAEQEQALRNILGYMAFNMDRRLCESVELSSLARMQTHIKQCAQTIADIVPPVYWVNLEPVSIQSHVIVLRGTFHDRSGG